MIRCETQTAVICRITQHEDAHHAVTGQSVQPFTHQCRADPLPLPLWKNGKRTKQRGALMSFLVDAA